MTRDLTIRQAVDLVRTSQHQEARTHTTAPVYEDADEYIRAFMDHRSTLDLRYRHALARRLWLKPDEMAAGLHLARGELTAGQLSLVLVLGVDDMLSLIAGLEEAGHVIRRPDAEDPRLEVVAVSDATLVWLTEVTGPLVEEIDALTAALNPHERATIGRFMEAATLISEREAERAARAALEGDRMLPGRRSG